MSENNKKMSLTARIFIGMLVGIIVGALLQTLQKTVGLEINAGNTPVSLFGFLVDGVFHVIGQIFIASLKMIVVPLVFVSLVLGTSSLSDPSKLGRLGGKSVGLYIFTTCIAITIAISFALLIGPGNGVTMEASTNFMSKEAPALTDVIINMFPSNPIQAMASGNMLQVIVFSLLFGISMSLCGEAGKKLNGFFVDLNEVIMRLVIILMNLAPYGVFALMAKLFATMGFDTILNLAKYFLLVFFVLIFHLVVTYSLLLKAFTGLNPLILFRKMRDAWAFAFSTSSSNATLPITVETATQKLGIKNSVASFTIPLGATINMDGTAIMQGVATVFIAQVFAQDLTTVDFLLVILTATLASIGTAGVPGVGLIMLAMVLQQVNLPVEGIALIIGVDRLLDMTRTVVNITGDCTVACIVAQTEGELDVDVFNDLEAGKEQEAV